MGKSQLNLCDYCFDLCYNHINILNSLLSFYCYDYSHPYIAFAIVHYIKNHGLAINDNLKEPSIEDFGGFVEMFFNEVIKEDEDKLSYEVKNDELVVKLEGENYNSEWLECLCKCFNFNIKINNNKLLISK